MEQSIILENRELRSKTKTMRRELEIMKQKIAMLEMQMNNQVATIAPTVYMQPATPVLPSLLPPSYMQPMNAYYPSYYEYQPEYYYPQTTDGYYPEPSEYYYPQSTDYYQQSTECYPQSSDYYPQYYDQKQMILMYPYEYESY
jgi:hypothetical protein